MDNGFIVIHGEPAGAQHCPHIHRLNSAFPVAVCLDLFVMPMSLLFAIASRKHPPAIDARHGAMFTDVCGDGWMPRRPG